MPRQTPSDHSIRTSDSKTRWSPGVFKTFSTSRLANRNACRMSSSVILESENSLTTTRDGRAADLLPEGLLDVLEGALELRLVPRDRGTRASVFPLLLVD